MDPIEVFLEKVKLGGKQSHLNLTLIPLLAPDMGEPDYLVLQEAMGQGKVEITEVSEGGRVPELKMINKSADKILVMDGEELIGAKQNRVVNATFLSYFSVFPRREKGKILTQQKAENAEKRS